MLEMLQAIGGVCEIALDALKAGDQIGRPSCLGESLPQPAPLRAVVTVEDVCLRDVVEPLLHEGALDQVLDAFDAFDAAGDHGRLDCLEQLVELVVIDLRAKLCKGARHGGFDLGAVVGLRAPVALGDGEVANTGGALAGACSASRAVGCGVGCTFRCVGQAMPG